MNEGIAVYLHINLREEKTNEELLDRIDRLLLDYGIRYSGIRNLYMPVENSDRDHRIYAACQALKKAGWMKKKLAEVSVLNRTDVCTMDEIRLDYMTMPRPGKLEYYEKYYLLSGGLAHGIIVDENRQLRDGYTSYILAKKYGIRPDIYEALSGQPVRKTVRGQHVEPDGDVWKIQTEKRYSWFYTLRAPVIPGDILKVPTGKGWRYMRVDHIGYTTGEEFCREHRRVRKHMKDRLEKVGCPGSPGPAAGAESRKL